MRGLPKPSKEYFAQFRTTPLKLKEFDPEAKELGIEFSSNLRDKLSEIKNVEVALRGSMLFEILGKGDIDIAVRANNKSFPLALQRLTNLFGSPKATGKTFAAFYTYIKDYEIEISLMKGHEARIDKALTEHLSQDRKTLNQYVQLKKKHCYSKREYLIQREKFLRKIIKSL